MEIAIIYDSKARNTKLLTNAIKGVSTGREVLCLDFKQEIVEADLYFIGSWIDKGNCSEVIVNVCTQLHNKKIALFGIYGFGGTGEYQATLYQRFAAHVSKDNTILGYFYCMGKMPLATRSRYVSMLQEHSEDTQIAVSIKNFDEASTHPDQKDIQNVQALTREIIAKC